MLGTDGETLRVAKMRALSGVAEAVPPALRSSAKAVETALLTRVIFLEEDPAGCNARLAASQLLALLPQATGSAFIYISNLRAGKGDQRDSTDVVPAGHSCNV